MRSAMITTDCSICPPVRSKRIAALRQQSADAMKDCNERLPPGNSKTAVVRAQCVNGAFQILLPTVRYPDLLQVFMTADLATLAASLRQPLLRQPLPGLFMLHLHR
jgi:hypothetical protein